jgi:hypothetical protein
VPVLSTGTEPPQPSDPVPPLALQDVAPIAAQLSFVEPPLRTEVGVAVRLPTTGKAGVTSSGALPSELPPGPVQVSVKAYSPGVLSVPVLTSVPSRACEPLQDPDAVHESAFDVDHVNAAALPATIVTGVTSTFTIGGVANAPTTTVSVFAALPPAPLQVNV